MTGAMNDEVGGYHYEVIRIKKKQTSLITVIAVKRKIVI